MPCEAPVMMATFRSLLTVVSFILLGHEIPVSMPQGRWDVISCGGNKGRQARLNK